MSRTLSLQGESGGTPQSPGRLHRVSHAERRGPGYRARRVYGPYDPPAPAERRRPGGGERSLGLFWKTPLDERDLGLAFAAVAGGDSGLRKRAFELLRKAESRDPEDVAVLAQLAQLYDLAGDEDRAIALSERAVRLDATQVAVAVNLGTYYVQRGRAREAMRSGPMRFHEIRH